MEGRKSRNCSLDVVRCVALIGVISIHFFLNVDFYDETVQGYKMYIMTIIRNLFVTCVPLFLMLSGYLQGNKKVSKDYYVKIFHVIIIYLLASVFCGVYSIPHNNMSIRGALVGIFAFYTAPYSWYIEMYLGLFLLIPFLNIIYKGLDSKRKKQCLIVSLVLLTSLPGIINIYSNMGIEWWITPSISSAYVQLYPKWWINFYPITYYFLGCYLKEYPIALSVKKQIVLMIALFLAFGSFNFYRSYNSEYIEGKWQSWGSLPVVILTVLVFSVFTHFEYNCLGKKMRLVISKVSEWSLGAYLVSWVFDRIVYGKLNEWVPVMQDRWPYFFITVPIVFILSILVSGVITTIGDFIYGIVVKIYNKIFDKLSSHPRVCR